MLSEVGEMKNTRGSLVEVDVRRECDGSDWVGKGEQVSLEIGNWELGIRSWKKEDKHISRDALRAEGEFSCQLFPLSLQNASKHF